MLKNIWFGQNYGKYVYVLYRTPERMFHIGLWVKGPRFGRIEIRKGHWPA